jgi:hypothetical protein
MQSDATQSAATRMRADPDKYRALLALLNGRDYKTFNLPQNTLYRWRRGELPDAFDNLLENPDVVMALLEDALRRKIERERSE